MVLSSTFQFALNDANQPNQPILNSGISQVSTESCGRAAVFLMVVFAVALNPSQSEADVLDLLLTDSSWLESCERAKKYVDVVAPKKVAITSYERGRGVTSFNTPISIYDLKLPLLPGKVTVPRLTGADGFTELVFKNDLGFDFTALVSEREPLADMWAKELDLSDVDAARSQRTKEILGDDNDVHKMMLYGIEHLAEPINCNEETIREDMKLFASRVLADHRSGVIAIHLIKTEELTGYVQLFEGVESGDSHEFKAIEAMVIGEERVFSIRYRYPSSATEFEQAVLSALTAN